MTARRIHILGASGSGTSTLGAALADRMGVAHLDSDDFYWLRTDPPYQTPRSVPERVALLRKALDAAGAWVLSGSLAGWGDPFMADFELVVFVYTAPEVRLPRLAERERRRYGAAIDPGGALHEHHLAFVDWAQSYDRPDFAGRSLATHRAWLSRLACPVTEVDGAQTPAAMLERATVAALTARG